MSPRSRSSSDPSRFRAVTRSSREGQPAECLYIIETGKVKVGRLTAQGRTQLIAVLGPADVFGELAVVDAEPRSFRSPQVGALRKDVSLVEEAVTVLEEAVEIYRQRGNDSKQADAVKNLIPRSSRARAWRRRCGAPRIRVCLLRREPTMGGDPRGRLPAHCSSSPTMRKSKPRVAPTHTTQSLGDAF